MKTITLTQRRVALVDDEDYARINKYKWYALLHRRTWYARCNIKMPDGKTKSIPMHRVVLGLVPGDGKITDHINRDGLDNRKSNLRLVNNATNCRNHRTYKHNTSGYTGVSWDGDRHRWLAYITANGKRIKLGRFKYIDNAIQARADGEEEYWT